MGHSPIPETIVATKVGAEGTPSTITVALSIPRANGTEALRSNKTINSVLLMFFTEQQTFALSSEVSVTSFCTAPKPAPLMVSFFAQLDSFTKLGTMEGPGYMDK